MSDLTCAADRRTPERIRLDDWSAEHPRDHLALVALAAWLNVTPEQLPEKFRTHTCETTMKAWARVADALRHSLSERTQAEPADVSGVLRMAKASAYTEIVRAKNSLARELKWRGFHDIGEYIAFEERRINNLTAAIAREA